MLVDIKQNGWAGFLLKDMKGPTRGPDEGYIFKNTEEDPEGSGGEGGGRGHQDAEYM